MTGPTRLLALLPLLAALASCAVDGADDAKAWRDVLDAGVPAPVGSYDTKAPLTLVRALKLANSANEALAIRGEDYAQALIAKDRAAAEFLPTITLSPSFSRQDETGLGGGAVDFGAFVPSRTFDVPASARLSLNPLRQVRATEAVGEEAEARRAELLDFRAGLLVDAARTFYGVRIAERRAAVLRDALATARQRVRDLEARLDAGVAAPVMVARARSDAARVAAALLDAENDAANGRTTLAFLAGVPAVEGELRDDLSPPGEVPADAELVDRARTRREDLRAAEARTRAAEAGVEAAFAEYFPSLSLDFTRFFQRDSFPSDVDWRGALGVNLPIFTAGRIRDDIRTAYSRFRQAKAAESLLSRRIEEEVRTARRDFLDGRRRRTILTERVDAAAEARRTVEAARSNGLATDLDVLLAEDDLRESRLALATEQLAGKLRWLVLLRRGGELESRLFEPSSPGDRP